MQKIQDEKKERIFLILLAAAIMIFVAQLNINLIINGFKISLAVICLPIFALLLEKFPVFPVTLIAAPGIFLVRSVVEWLNDGSWQEAFASYSPEMLFYLCYGALFALYVSKIKFDSFKLVRLLPLVGIDIVSNLAEMLLRVGSAAFGTQVLVRLLTVAVGRTALAAIFLAAFDAYGIFILKNDDRIRYRKLLLLTAQLKSEMIWMNKNTSRIEETMAVSYSLFNELNTEGSAQSAQKALTVAKDIHEIKKEYYLIMNGISAALNIDREENGMWLKNIFQVLQESVSYVFAGYGKNMEISTEMEKNFYTDRHYYLMSVLRNLMNNAAEAAGDKHTHLLLKQKESGENVEITVHDDCGGIDPEYLPTIFMPGFSTKIDYETGKVSRGLGLSLVKDIVESELGGKIEVRSQDGCTDFILTIPKKNLEVAVK